MDLENRIEKPKERKETNNWGFDNENGDILLKIGQHIAYRFEIVDTLGKGSFGQVVKVKDHKKNIICALKIIRNKKRFHKQGKVEVELLEACQKNDPSHKKNIVRIFGYFKFRDHICISFELLNMNLYEFLRLNHFQGFKESLVKRFSI